MKLNTLVLGYEPMENTAVDPSKVWELQQIKFNDKFAYVIMNNIFKIGMRLDGYKNDRNVVGKGYSVSYNNDFMYLNLEDSMSYGSSSYHKSNRRNSWKCSTDIKTDNAKYDTMRMYPTPYSFSPTVAVATEDNAETLLSILINTNVYQLVKYHSYSKTAIKTTMHLPETVNGWRNSAVGCVLSFPNSIISLEYDSLIFNMILKVRRTGEIMNLIIYSDHNGEIMVVRMPTTVEIKTYVTDLLRSRRSDKTASDNFRVESRDIETSLILIPEHNDIELRLSSMANKHSTVIEVPDDLLLSNDDNKIIKYLDSKLPKNKPGKFKAVTLVGRLFLPIQVVRHFRWLYVFKFDGSDIITCIKSP